MVQPRCHLLESLPLEIRLQIWINVLTSNTGIILVRRGARHHIGYEVTCADPFSTRTDAERATLKTLGYRIGDSIKLSFYRTCKQIYNETKGLLWKHNEYMYGFLSDEQIPEDPSIRAQLMYVRLVVDLNRWGAISSTPMSGLARMAKSGKIKTVTLQVARVFSHFVNLDQSLLSKRDHYHRQFCFDIRGRRRNLFQIWLEAFRKAREVLGDAKRRIEIVTGWNENSLAQLDVVRSRDVNETLLKFLKAMHESFGGEFWQDGVLCYKDGIEISRPFALPLDVERQIHKVLIDGLWQCGQSAYLNYEFFFQYAQVFL